MCMKMHVNEHDVNRRKKSVEYVLHIQIMNSKVVSLNQMATGCWTNVNRISHFYWLEWFWWLLFFIRFYASWEMYAHNEISWFAVIIINLRLHLSYRFSSFSFIYLFICCVSHSFIWSFRPFYTIIEYKFCFPPFFFRSNFFYSLFLKIKKIIISCAHSF